MAIDIGRIAFTEYYKTLTKDQMEDAPTWEEQNQEQQNAWRHAACAVVSYIDSERERIRKDPGYCG